MRVKLCLLFQFSELCLVGGLNGDQFVSLPLVRGVVVLQGVKALLADPGYGSGLDLVRLGPMRPVAALTFAHAVVFVEAQVSSCASASDVPSVLHLTGLVGEGAPTNETTLVLVALSDECIEGHLGVCDQFRDGFQRFLAAAILCLLNLGRSADLLHFGALGFSGLGLGVAVNALGVDPDALVHLPFAVGAAGAAEGHRRPTSSNTNQKNTRLVQ